MCETKDEWMHIYTSACTVRSYKVSKGCILFGLAFVSKYAKLLPI